MSAPPVCLIMDPHHPLSVVLKLSHSLTLSENSDNSFSLSCFLPAPPILGCTQLCPGVHVSQHSTSSCAKHIHNCTIKAQQTIPKHFLPYDTSRTAAPLGLHFTARLLGISFHIPLTLEDIHEVHTLLDKYYSGSKKCPNICMFYTKQSKTQ